MSDLVDISTADSAIVIHDGGATVFGPIGLPVPSTLRMGAQMARYGVAPRGVARSADVSGQADLGAPARMLHPDASRSPSRSAGVPGTWPVAAGATLAAAR